MKYLIASFLLVFFVSAKSQQVNRMYTYSYYNNIADDIEKYDDNTYYISCSFDTYGDLILKVDSLGDIIKGVVLFNGNIQERAISNSLEIIDDKIYFLTKLHIHREDSADESSIIFTCFNLDFDTLWSHKYLADSNSVYANTFTPTEDGGFAIAGNSNKTDPESAQAIILKVDSLGNYEWDKEYGYENNDVITSIVQTQDKGYIISGYSCKYNLSYDDWYIVRVDSSGNQIWDWILRNPAYNVSNANNLNDGDVADLIQTKDGNFIAVGGKSYHSNNVLLQDARLLKFDINKNVLLDTLYSEVFEMHEEEGNRHSRFVKIKEKENGNLIIISKRQARPDDIPAIEISNLYELDKNFKIIKKREFGATSYSNNGENIRDFIIEEDGSLAMIGYVYLNSYYMSKPYQRPWFIKTDANYCDGFGSCDTNLAIHFFPPDTLFRTDTVDLQFEIISSWDIDYNLIFTYFRPDLMKVAYDTVYNASVGNVYSLRVSYDWLEASNANLNTGYYYHRIRDTVFIMCKIVPSDSTSKAVYYTTIRANKIIFVDEPIGISEIRESNNFSIQPNPAQDYILIKKALLKRERVELLDISGKVLREYQMNNKELKISVSNLNNGLYFIKKGSRTKKLIINK